MSQYIVKNLDKINQVEVRIYRVSKEGLLTPISNFTTLDELGLSASVQLKPDYSINCTGAFSYVGNLQSTITTGTTLTTTEGDVVSLETDLELVNILKTNFNLDAIILQDYVPSAIEVPLANEIYFITTTGTVDYSGSIGDVINLSDGTIFNLEGDLAENIVVPAGKHKVTLNEVRESNYVGIGGEALVELHNFPTLSSITSFDFWPNNNSINLIKVPTTLPSNITSLAYMFGGALTFNQDISGWDVSQVTDLSSMFSNTNSFNQPLNNWNVSNVTTMFQMFFNAAAFNQDISSWNTSSVTDMTGMFSKAALNNAMNFNQDISQWCVGLIAAEPTNFNMDGILQSNYKPVWGTCPRGENVVYEL